MELISINCGTIKCYTVELKQWMNQSINNIIGLNLTWDDWRCKFGAQIMKFLSVDFVEIHVVFAWNWHLLILRGSYNEFVVSNKIDGIVDWSINFVGDFHYWKRICSLQRNNGIVDWSINFVISNVCIIYITERNDVCGVKIWTQVSQKTLHYAVYIDKL